MCTKNFKIIFFIFIYRPNYLRRTYTVHVLILCCNNSGYRLKEQTIVMQQYAYITSQGNICGNKRRNIQEHT